MLAFPSDDMIVDFNLGVFRREYPFFEGVLPWVLLWVWADDLVVVTVLEQQASFGIHDWLKNSRPLVMSLLITNIYAIRIFYLYSA